MTTRSRGFGARCRSLPPRSRGTRPRAGVRWPPVAESGQGSSGRSSRASGGFTVHLAEELEVYFNEVAHGRPVGFVSSSKWKPPTDIYETDDALVVYMDIAGMRSEDFTVEYVDGDLTVVGARPDRRTDGELHHHAMEVQVGPFERRFRLP